MKNFEELELIEKVQRALADNNYKVPTPIQAQTIPAALEGKDILGCAQTGTGKTAAFALPILHAIGKNNRKAMPKQPFALILSPTRELAVQIGDSFRNYGRHLRLRQALVYGGVSQMSQVRALNRGAHVVIATPGRLLDLMNQGHLRLGQLETFVLDEADRMLDMGFMPDLKRIISELPDQRQSLFFSATISPKIKELSQTLLRKPVTVNVTPKQANLTQIQQQVMFVEKKGKQELLRKILKKPEVVQTLVFTKTKRTANDLAERLERTGVKATAIHGNKSQAARQRALDSFRRKRVSVLVATDVAARGIDIDSITHVVNYDLPLEPENYVHRIGRTGRAGAKGVALSFCSPNERRELRAIEQLIGQRVPTDPDAPVQPVEQRESRSGYKGGQSRGRGGNSNGGAKRFYGKGGKRFGSKGSGSKGSYSKSYGSKRSYAKGSTAGGAAENNSGENGASENGSNENGSAENRTSENGSASKRSGSKRPYAKGGQRSGSKSKRYGSKSSGAKRYGSKSSEAKSAGSKRPATAGGYKSETAGESKSAKPKSKQKRRKRVERKQPVKLTS